MTPNDEVMTVADVAKYLKLAEKTVLRMANRSEIPGAKVASQWRFRRSMIDDWLMSKMKVIPQTDIARLVERGSDILPISRLIAGDFILMNLKPGTKEEILRQLVQPLAKVGIVEEEETFLEKLMMRERMVSTAIGKGIAIPHIRNPRENPAGPPDLVVGICPEGTDFESADRDRTYLFFLLVTDSEVVHLRVMAKIATILRQADVVSRLINARNRDDVINTLIEADQKMLAV